MIASDLLVIIVITPKIQISTFQIFDALKYVFSQSLRFQVSIQ